MTSQSPGADPTRPDGADPPAAPDAPPGGDAADSPDEERADAVAGTGAGDADDWWDGTVELAPDERPAADGGSSGTGGAAAAGDGGASGEGTDGGARSGTPRSWLLGAAVVVLVAGLGVLVAGATSDDGGSPATAGATGYGQDGRGQGGPGGPGGFGPGTSGTITEIDDGASTLAVETSSGEAVEVSATDETGISETVEGSVDDLEIGDSVLVVGASDDGDGSTIAAQQVVASSDGDLLGGGAPGDGERPQPPEGGFPGGGEVPEGFDPRQGGGPDGPGDGGGRGAGGFATGTIESIGNGSVTVQTGDGETVTVTLSSDTTVLRSQELSFDDLATGDEVAVLGTADEDEGDIVVATTIRRGEAGFGFGGGFPGGGGDGGDGGTT